MVLNTEVMGNPKLEGENQKAIGEGMKSAKDSTVRKDVISVKMNAIADMPVISAKRVDTAVPVVKLNPPENI